MIRATNRCCPACTSTWAATLSLVTRVTMPGKRLRADWVRGREGRGFARHLHGEAGQVSTVDEPAAARSQRRLHFSCIGPATNRVRADPEDLGRLTDAVFHEDVTVARSLVPSPNC